MNENEIVDPPIRVMLSRKKGWKMPSNTVSVARPTKWGNPFVVGEHGTRKRCVELYRLLAAGYVSLTYDDPESLRASRAAMEDAPRELRGKNLACWCPLDQPCHADTLLEIANR